MITIEEVQHCLDELDETISSQKEVEKIIGTTLLNTEYNKLTCYSRVKYFYFRERICGLRFFIS